ncbi:inorganic phosphate transporter [Gallibacterium anatis]|uniref:Phosphate transporter n=2 Tax=Gallibacterium TaxID=155493 RepID=A0A1A7NXI9_9PAST|nr:MULTISPECIES: inorganic phosphate transporter [Gallibacterium]KGQ58325.1 phosphate permease [Gallibacterium anatis DSM 16844 = F 149]OBW94912.1 phosphate permease [Gallibacterium anatis]OBW99216.1 phosphate permease [Gallibacterium anatis]OBX03287.1 phosphate permease [Gallibacterium genomosp. 1]OBX03398.1 phosphate permease [Gallibacterium genomosp. 1]
METLSNYSTLLVILTAVFGFLMAFGIGANDVSNAMGTSVGSKAITPRQAIIIAIIFEGAGAYLAGGEVAETIKDGIIDPTLFIHQPDILVLGMMGALLSAGFWLVLASRLGWPVSTTHTIIGAIVGFACVTIGSDAVEWSSLLGIFGSWIITPFIAGIIAYLIFVSTQKLIFDTDSPLLNAKQFAPFYMGLTIFIISLVTIKKGLKHIGLHLSNGETFLISLALCVIAIIACFIYLRSQSFEKKASAGFGAVEKVFRILMLLTACSMAFAHGSNDVANAIGPLSAVVSIIDHGGVIAGKTTMAWWVLPLGALGIIAGLAVMGQRVMETIGTGITDLTPSRGFAAQFATATTVILASGTGLPISTTQTLVGAVLGVGFARGIAALNLTVIRNIISSWIITLPAGAVFSIIIFYILKAILL